MILINSVAAFLACFTFSDTQNNSVYYEIQESQGSYARIILEAEMLYDDFSSTPYLYRGVNLNYVDENTTVSALYTIGINRHEYDYNGKISVCLSTYGDKSLYDLNVIIRPFVYATLGNYDEFTSKDELCMNYIYLWTLPDSATYESPLFNPYSDDDYTYYYGFDIITNIPTLIQDGEDYYSGYSDGYENGKSDGLVEGQSSGYQEGYQEGSQTGYTTGYTSGYNQGVEDSSGDYGFMSLFATIADVPILMMRSMFSFDLFGTTMLSVFLSLFTALLIIYIAKKILIK